MALSIFFRALFKFQALWWSVKLVSTALLHQDDASPRLCCCHFGYFRCGGGYPSEKGSHKMIQFFKLTNVAIVAFCADVHDQLHLKSVYIPFKKCIYLKKNSNSNQLYYFTNRPLLQMNYLILGSWWLVVFVVIYNWEMNLIAIHQYQLLPTYGFMIEPGTITPKLYNIITM